MGDGASVLPAGGHAGGGTLYIGTPVEFFPDHLRYVDLELDVVRLPDGTRRLEDEGVLEDKLARGLLPPALGQEARRIAVGLLQGLAVASHRMDLQQSFPPSP